MALGSNTARDAVLNATLGSTQAAGIPDPLYLALFNGDPGSGGTELTIGTGGYARKSIAKTDWGSFFRWHQGQLECNLVRREYRSMVGHRHLCRVDGCLDQW